MNLQQAKALFFAQYMWQSVLMNDNNLDEGLSLFPLELEPGLIDYNGDWYLVLRSVSDLTEEEYYNIAILCGFLSEKYNRIEMADLGHAMISAFLEDFNISINAYRYLLCIGVLLPFTYIDETGKPVTLSPEQIIALGWAKYADEVL